MANFLWIGERVINLDQVTEIRFRDEDREGRPRVKVYFPGGGDDERDYTTLTVEEGVELARAVLESNGRHGG